MIALLIHGLVFVGAVGSGGILFSLAVRWVARRFGLTFEAPWRWLPLSIALAALAGLAGQFVFSIVESAGANELFARLGGWLVSASLAIQAVRLITPFMPPKRTLLVGLLAGLGGELGFYTALYATGYELAAQLAGLGTMLAVFSLAVVFPAQEPLTSQVYRLIAPPFNPDDAPATTIPAPGTALGIGQAITFSEKLFTISTPKPAQEDIDAQVPDKIR